MSIDLGRIKFDARRLFKQIRSDLKDDWFPDPLIYGDMLESGLITAGINKNFEANHGQYVPSKRDLLNIPKPNFTLRYALETGLADRILYHGLASFLIPFFDKHIPWNVFSHRYNYLRPNERYMFRRPISAWQDFVGAVRSSLTAENVLLSTDIANYFENIALVHLKTALLEILPLIEATPLQKSEVRAHIDLLFACLNDWAYESDRGIPQNRDASSFLANIYMRKVDKAMLGQGYSYFRYMDDIKIVCSNTFEARKALKELSLQLRSIGLSINSKKTVIKPGNDTSDCLEGGSRDIQHIDELWRTRSRAAILRLLPELKKFTLKLVHEDKTDSRDFRFCIKRLEFLALCDDLFVPPEFYDDVTPEIVKAIAKYPASTDQYVRYLLAVKTDDATMAAIARHLRDTTKSIYGWQNYRLWCLLAQKKYKDSEQLAFASAVVNSCADAPSRAGATLYIGTVGEREQKIEVAKNFKTLNTFLGQRSALIATHELPFGDCIKEHVKDHVRLDLVGVYKKLHGDRRGVYFAPVERMSVSKAMDLERDYE